MTTTEQTVTHQRCIGYQRAAGKGPQGQAATLLASVYEGIREDGHTVWRVCLPDGTVGQWGEAKPHIDIAREP